MITPGLFALALLATAVPFGAGAQSIYRGTGADGKVIFSDTPVPGASAPVGGIGTQATTASPLPYALRQVAVRFPVVFYSGPDCAPCDSGRTLLATRGIPYTERTITSEQDAQALQRVSNERRLPLLTIGSHHLKGFSGAEWNQYLDAAGYPKMSALPAGWRAPAAQPLAPRAVAAPRPPSESAPPAPEPAPFSLPSAPTAGGPNSGGSNPAGIRF